MANAGKFRSGQMDVPLTLQGREHIQMLAPRLLNLKPFPQRVVTSPLARALESAQIIVDVLKLPLVQEKDLQEQHYGHLEGQDLKTIREKYGDQDDVAPPNGETFAAFQHRVLNALQKMLLQDSRLPLIVGHGGTMNALRNAWDLPYEKTHNGDLFWVADKKISKIVSV